MFVGLFLIILGSLFILDNLNLLAGRVWDFAWPLFIICFGVSIIYQRTKRGGGSNKKRDS